VQNPPKNDKLLIITKAVISTKTEVLHMTKYNTIGHNLKRGIVNFCNKISGGFGRPAQKFIADMVFGIIASKSCHLTKIGRTLNEEIKLDKTVERLSRNLMNFDGGDEFMENYFNSVKNNFDDKTVIIIDDGDVAKPHSVKLEGICSVRDGSTGEITEGYMTVGVSALTAKQNQPIPVYNRIYSTEEKGYVSNNAETLKALEFISAHFSKDNIRTFDRGYDSGFLFDYLLPQDEKFIVRMVGNRNCVYKGKTILLSTLAARFKGKFVLKFEAKDGKKVNCKISIVPVELPKYPGKKLNLVICTGFGKGPLMLLTNLESDDKRLCVTVSKVYLMRWRIEEYYRFKKQGFGFEKFLVRSLKSIRNLDLLLTAALGHIGALSEKVDDSIEVIGVVLAAKRLYGLALFTFYSISDGLFAIFSKSYTGIKNFFVRPKTSLQLTLPWVV
jgi:hypothetical protein